MESRTIKPLQISLMPRVGPQQATSMQATTIPAQAETGLDITSLMNLMITMMIVMMMMKMMAGMMKGVA